MLNKLAFERCSDISLLKEPFQGLIKQLIQKLKDAGLNFHVFETLRSDARQIMLLDHGVSHKRHSLHEDGLACDLVEQIGGKWDWSDEKAYAEFGKVVNSIPGLAWGGDLWAHGPHPFIDMDHVQLAAPSAGACSSGAASGPPPSPPEGSGV